ncbi:unnamed protein product [Effrenium voratum]|uniref:Uncharacterized protein n=1 Tax=Effrenium voratum TaxID=2562239 RepID=A0AA36J3N8_9DINO|nr:unnamed protein product [Effrenium voratum]CAJ1439564.1 unnamed protein product [Effrenium voratum]
MEELTLQTLQSLVGVEGCSWAELLERVESLVRLAEGRKSKAPEDEEREVEELQGLLLQAEMDLDEKEQQLEEQSARVRDLSAVLAKQQNAWASTSAITGRWMRSIRYAREAVRVSLVS